MVAKFRALIRLGAFPGVPPEAGPASCRDFNGHPKTGNPKNVVVFRVWVVGFRVQG